MVANSFQKRCLTKKVPHYFKLKEVIAATWGFHESHFATFDKIEIPTKFHPNFVEIWMSKLVFRFGFDFNIEISILDLIWV
jgi:hypothetical protein